MPVSIFRLFSMKASICFGVVGCFGFAPKIETAFLLHAAQTVFAFVAHGEVAPAAADVKATQVANTAANPIRPFQAPATTQH